MAQVLTELSPKDYDWIHAQKMFFVATAPLDGQGHINCSPKGGPCFKLLNDQTFIYIDYTGSGTETAAHLLENERICIMFCAFEGPPKIMRFHGHGEVLTPDHPDFAGYVTQLAPNPGTRALIRVHIQRIASSCGFSVPFYDYVADRDTLDKWAENRGPDGLTAYRQEKNAQSIDGLPGVVHA